MVQAQQRAKKRAGRPSSWVDPALHLICRIEVHRQILLNDLDISSSHMERLIKELHTSPAITQNFLESEVEQVKASISSFTNLVPRFRSTLRVSPALS